MALTQVAKRFPSRIFGITSPRFDANSISRWWMFLLKSKTSHIRWITRRDRMASEKGKSIIASFTNRFVLLFFLLQFMSFYCSSWFLKTESTTLVKIEFTGLAKSAISFPPSESCAPLSSHAIAKRREKHKNLPIQLTKTFSFRRLST